MGDLLELVTDPHSLIDAYGGVTTPLMPFALLSQSPRVRVRAAALQVLKCFEAANGFAAFSANLACRATDVAGMVVATTPPPVDVQPTHRGNRDPKPGRNRPPRSVRRSRDEHGRKGRTWAQAKKQRLRDQACDRAKARAKHKALRNAKVRQLADKDRADRTEAQAAKDRVGAVRIVFDTTRGRLEVNITDGMLWLVVLLQIAALFRVPVNSLSIDVGGAPVDASSTHVNRNSLARQLSVFEIVNQERIRIATGLLPVVGDPKPFAPAAGASTSGSSAHGAPAAPSTAPSVGVPASYPSPHECGDTESPAASATSSTGGSPSVAPAFVSAATDKFDLLAPPAPPPEAAADSASAAASTSGSASRAPTAAPSTAPLVGVHESRVPSPECGDSMPTAASAASSTDVSPLVAPAVVSAAADSVELLARPAPPPEECNDARHGKEDTRHKQAKAPPQLVENDSDDDDDLSVDDETPALVESESDSDSDGCSRKNKVEKRASVTPTAAVTPLVAPAVASAAGARVDWLAPPAPPPDAAAHFASAAASTSGSSVYGTTAAPSSAAFGGVYESQPPPPECDDSRLAAASATSSTVGSPLVAPAAAPSVSETRTHPGAQLLRCLGCCVISLIRICGTG